MPKLSKKAKRVLGRNLKKELREPSKKSPKKSRRKDVCVACEGSGISSKGGICFPCKGTGRREETR